MNTSNHIFSRSYFGTTVADPFCLMVLLLMIVLIICVSRRYAVWPMIVIACFITQAQRLSPGGLDFTFLRIITIFALLRVAVRGEFSGFSFNSCDYAVLAFMGIKLLWSVLKITKGGNSITSPLTLCGDALDMWGMYFFFRFVVRDLDDLKYATYGFILAAIVNAPFFIYEYTSGHNWFFFMQGVSDSTRSRDGKLRCMGAYSHPILAGCFWAALLPYMGAVIKQKGRIKILPLLGIVSASIMILASGSSSPIAAAGLAFCGGCAFLFRKRMRAIRWVTFLTVAAAQLLANSPVWKVFARVQIIGGSTGYYRFKLIDQFIRHFNEWWLAGSSRGTATWSVQMFDIVNYYVALGLAGGLLFVLLLVGLLVTAFQNCGKAMRLVKGNSELELMAWSTGVAVFTHMMTFLAVTYYGQIIMVWYFALAVTGVRSVNVMQGRGFSVITGRNSDPLSRLAARPVLPYRPVGAYAGR